jgi:hypothetical protein
MRTVAAPASACGTANKRSAETGRRGLDGESLRFGGVEHKYGFMVLCRLGRAMKTTVEVSDDLYRRAKSEAALRGRKLKDLIEEGLRLVLEAPSTVFK